MQQLLDTVDGMVCDPLEHVTQIAFRIQVVEFRGAEETVDCCGTLATIIGSGEEPVLAAQGHRTQCAFGGVIVNLKPTVIAVARECRPEREARNGWPRRARSFFDNVVTVACSQAFKASSSGPARV